MEKELEFIDTNIIIYAEDSHTDKHDAASKVLDKIINEGRAVASIQTLVEASSVLGRNGFSADERNRIISSYAKVIPILKYGLDEILIANKISDEAHMPFYDALIAATMNLNGITRIVTENERDFRNLSWIKIINPFRKQ